MKKLHLVQMYAVWNDFTAGATIQELVEKYKRTRSEILDAISVVAKIESER